MVTRRVGALLLLLVGGAQLAGCVGQGLIYTRTVQPLTTDFSATPVAVKGSGGDVHTVSFYVNVEWGQDGLGAIARSKGIAEIYYADVTTISVLRYWKRNVVRVYGRPVESAADALPVVPARAAAR